MPLSCLRTSHGVVLGGSGLGIPVSQPGPHSSTVLGLWSGTLRHVDGRGFTRERKDGVWTLRVERCVGVWDGQSPVSPCRPYTEEYQLTALRCALLAVWGVGRVLDYVVADVRSLITPVGTSPGGVSHRDSGGVVRLLSWGTGTRPGR